MDILEDIFGIKSKRVFYWIAIIILVLILYKPVKNRARKELKESKEEMIELFRLGS